MGEDLKTLKDMGSKSFSVESPYQQRYYTEVELKQELIKWIKDFKIDYDQFGSPYSTAMPLTPITETFTFNKEGTKLLLPKDAIINFIKHFGNIKDEDLK